MLRGLSSYTSPPTQPLTGQDVIVISLSDWNSPKRIRQYLSEALLRKNNRVLFVEAEYTFTKFLRRPSLRRSFGFLRGSQKLRDNLFLVSAPPFIPGGEFSAAIARVNWLFALRFIKHAVNKLNMKNPVLLIFAYNAQAVVGALRERLAVYFSNDAFHLLVPKPFSRRVLDMERRLMAKVGAVFTVSDKLTREKADFHPKVHTIYHGVDLEAFTSSENAQRPADIPQTRPLIGYSGVLRDMIDVDLLNSVVTQRSDWSLVLVGPRAQSSRAFQEALDRLARHKNVFLLGPKPPASLPSYLRAFDVCLIPYVRGEISTYYSAPLKFYEYLAAGKRVISTVGPSSYDEGVVMNRTAGKEFLEAIELALKSDSEELVQRRIHIAQDNSWDARLREMEAFLVEPSPR